MRFFIRPFLVILLLNLLFIILPVQAQTDPNLKPRIIVLTDLKRVQETDDTQSLVRLLSLADLIEIEGIVISSGFNYWKEEHILSGYELVWELIDAYKQSVGNLMRMNDQKVFDLVEEKQVIGYWPSPTYLIQRTVRGTPLSGLDQVGVNKSNPGSNLITNIIDEDDPRPVYVLAWGGINVLAQSIYDIAENQFKKRSKEAVEAFIKKIRVISIADQDQPWLKRNEPSVDNNSGYWLRKTFPNLFWVKVSPGPFMKISTSMQPFYQMHIQGHGKLGDMYPDHSNSAEGDTPSLFYVLPLGLSDPEQPEWGSIAGIFAKGPWDKESGTSFWHENVPGRKEIMDLSLKYGERWIQSMWNLFAARMDWARSGTGNRVPVVIVNGSKDSAILKMDVKAGEEITLDGSATYDNESDKLTYKWSVLEVPDSYKGKVDLIDSQSNKCKIRIPSDASSKDIHVLFEVTDDGAGHHLTSFKRIILKIK